MAESNGAMADSMGGANFVATEITGVVKESIEKVIGGQPYSNSLACEWTAAILQKCLSGLTELSKQYKYIVNCTILQKSGAGLHTGNTCFWDKSSDSTCTIRWENPNLYCILSVFVLSV